MTRSIRADLEGVVHTYREDGSEGPVLSKGDVVPDGVVVGDHLLATEDDDTEADQAVADPQTDGARGQASADDTDAADGDGTVDETDGEDDGDAADDSDDDAGLDKPAGNASTEAWENYADARGIEYAEGAGRDEIRAAVAEHDAAEHEG